MHFAVIGDPIAHSKSPAMHTAALGALGLTHTYEALQTSIEELPHRVAALRSGVYDGLNVTLPYKRSVLDFVDQVDLSAARVDAANTLIRTEAGITAYNTDVPALIEELRLLAPVAGDALVLGSGGAARAAIAALMALGYRPIMQRARRMFNPLKPNPAIDSTLAIIIQATSAGMTGTAPGDGIAASVAWDVVPKTAIAFDVVYTPAETPFLRKAREHGLRSSNGLGMLAGQAALSLSMWIGAPVPTSVMQAALSTTRAV